MKVKKEWAPHKSAPTEISISDIIARSGKKPTAYWAYLNADGSIHHIRMRYDLPDGRKNVLPYTYGTLDCQLDWHIRAPTAPFPLFNLPEILSRKEAPILIVEGEKAAEAAKRLFPEYVVTTTAGGCGAPSKSNMSPLKGRDVSIWPDNDDAGMKYADKLIVLLADVGTKSIRLVEVPPSFPPHWDLADEIADGYCLDGICELLANASDATPNDGIEPLPMICMSDVAPEDVNWLWDPFIARGNLTMLDGDPGLGKSHVTLAIATALSNGELLPAQSMAARGTTLLVSCEDSLGCSIKPRLIAMGANCDYIFAHPELFTLDIEGQLKLRKTVEQQRPDFMVIDPIFAYMGAGVDTNSANKVRAILAPLAKLAEEFQCAIVCVRHLSKGTNGQSLMHRGMGSIDFSAAARSTLTVMQHPENEKARVIIHSKTNIGPKGPSIEFSFEGNAFRWLGISEIRESDFVDQQTTYTQKTTSKGSEAEDFLREILAPEPQKSTVIFDMAEERGISKSSLNRAKDRLGIISTKGRGESSAWIWSLPKKDTPTPPPSNVENVEKDDIVPEDPDIESYLQHFQDIQDSHDFGPIGPELHYSPEQEGIIYDE
jgi:putative DNA primase/helicase